ncbi:MAG: hypothetical protein ACKPBU_11805, partial [Alphaproteobacteria bacterium]
DTHCHYYSPQFDAPEGTYCPRDCLGDFTEALREALEWMSDGDEENLGICDAHGTDVLVGVDYGRTWITHLIPWTPAYDWKRPDDESPGNESR